MFDPQSPVSGSRERADTGQVDGLETAHPTPLGRRAFIAGAAGAIAATAISSTASAAPAGASYYEAVGPIRVADTRTRSPYRNVHKSFQRINDRTIRIDIRNELSKINVSTAGVVAVVISIAAEYNGRRGWVQAVPAGTNAEVSNINMENGDSVVANMATVRLPGNGKIDIKGHHPYDVVVDVSGVYRATSTSRKDGRLKFLPKVQRAASGIRMSAGSTRTVRITQVPPSAQAVVVNLTAAYSRSSGYYTAWASGPGAPPTVSNLNYGAGDTRAVGAIVKLGQSGGVPAINIYSHGRTDLYVDVAGYITGPTDVDSTEGLFVPINPYRAMDTRRAADRIRTGKLRLWPGWSRPFKVTDIPGIPASQVGGLSMNATLVTAMRLGYVTVLPAQTVRDEVSNLNVSRPGHIVANHVISRVSSEGVEFFAHCGGDVIADVAGWFVGTPQAATYSNPLTDPPPPPAAFNWLLQVPRMGLQNYVIPNTISGDPVVDAGQSWHWTNTGMVGSSGASIVVFGHRTSGSAPYYYQHALRSGDDLFVSTNDQRRFHYRYVSERLTTGSATQILNAARTNASGTTFTLVACTGNRYTGALSDQPGGSTRWRIVSTFRLVGWTDTSPPVG